MKLKLVIIAVLLEILTVGASGGQLVSSNPGSYETQKDHGRLDIGKNGAIQTIAVADSSCAVSVFAAEELQRYFEMITGTRLRIDKTGSARKGTMSIRLILDKKSKLVWDGFRIESGKNGIVISAKEPRGLLYGAYQILEDAGCLFVYLDKSQEIVPHLTTVELKKGTRIFNPRLEHRGLVPDGLYGGNVELGRQFIDWMAKNKLNYILVSVNRPSDSPGPELGIIWKDVEKELLPELQKRNFVIEMSEHCTHEFFPRSLFNEHPDWFALNDGVRKLGNPPYSGQMCYSNKGAVEYYANEVAKYAAVHPEFYVIGTWPLDGGKYCECEGCKNPLTVFNAAMRVAEKVKEVRPDMIVEHLAYKPQTWQPTGMDQIPDNMSILWCPDSGELDSLARKWVYETRNAGGVYQFEYYMGDNYRYQANVWLRPQHEANVVKHANEIGFRGVISLFLPLDNWWRSCFNGWFFAKACWTTDPDIKAWLHDYCQKYYGNSAGDVENIFYELFTEMQPEPYKGIWDKKFIDRNETVQPVAEKIKKQLAEVIDHSGDPVVKERLVWLKTYVEYFQLFSQAFSDRKKENLEKVMDYSKNHPDVRNVVINPEFIRWRDAKYFK